MYFPLLNMLDSLFLFTTYHPQGKKSSDQTQEESCTQGPSGPEWEREFVGFTVGSCESINQKTKQNEKNKPFAIESIPTPSKQ